MRVRIFTDGACSDNPGPGGWAVVINNEDSCSTLSGYELKTTNNRMELMAVVKVFEKILEDNIKGVEYDLYSDSAYVVNAINNHWVEKWENNNWKTTKLEDVKNKDLWNKLMNIKYAMSLKGLNSINIIKIKGHNGNSFNELVDKIAKEETAKAKQIILKDGKCND